MTRLIDADAINPMRVPQSVKEMRAWIDSQPTVEAIPIEWIMDFIENTDLEYKRIALRSVLVQWQLESNMGKSLDEVMMEGSTITEAKIDGFGIKLVLDDKYVFEYDASDGGCSDWEIRRLKNDKVD